MGWYIRNTKAYNQSRFVTAFGILIIEGGALQDLSRLLKPKSICVIGGGTWCRSVIEQCEKIGFRGDIWPVHLTAKHFANRKAYKCIDDLPSPPDASFVGINRQATIKVVRKLSRRNSGGAVCFASGFLESKVESKDGQKLQRKLIEAANKMPLIGPNCYGFVNYLDGVALWPDQHGGRRVDRGVALITQSSNIAINLSMQQRGLPIAYLVTVGNQAQIDLAEIGQTLLQDNRVTALGLHIEGISNIKTFEQLADAARRAKKGIAVIKVGCSKQAQVATLTHTASLAGSDAGARAVLKRLGMAQVKDLSQLLETLKLLHMFGPLRDSRIASMSCSGGEASLMADTGYLGNVKFPELNKIQRNGLRAVLGPMVALANPLDYHTYVWGDAKKMGAIFSAMLQGDLDIGCVIVDFPRQDICSQEAWKCVLKAGIMALKTSKVPLAFVSSLPENLPENIALDLMQSGILSLCGLSESLAAIEAASFIGKSLSKKSQPMLQGNVPRKPIVIDEADAKHRLINLDLKFPRRKLIENIEEIQGAVADIGFPLVLKGRGLAHKTDSGAVKLGLNSINEVKKAAKDIGTKKFLIEEMITDSIGELLIGVIRDKVHGFVMTLAAGGELTEILKDRCSLMLPVTKGEVLIGLKSLKFYRLLSGYRGRQAVNLNKIVTAIMAIQEYTQSHKDELEEIEINPLIITPDRVIVADALIVQGEANAPSPNQK